LYNKLPIKLKHSKKGTLLKEYISLPDAPKVGDRFIDCTQLTPEMKSESISDNLGKKFTIIEFWASWCGSCRRDHPIMRKMYNLYHKKGLNIISISCDENTERWKNAIKQDCIPWDNISDLKGWYNKAFMIYGIKGVPQMILLDNNGIIVDDNFVNVSMESELSKRFNKTDLRGGITVSDGKNNKWQVPNNQIKL
jgi:thiol-disulfide isomerase/thioredoxin